MGNRRWFSLERLEAGERYPRGAVFAWHGKDDSVILVGGSEREEKMKKVEPELYFRWLRCRANMGLMLGLRLTMSRWRRVWS
jgi:hypothetical protein